MQINGKLLDQLSDYKSLIHDFQHGHVVPIVFAQARGKEVILRT